MDFIVGIINILQETYKRWLAINLLFFSLLVTSSVTLADSPIEYKYQQIADIADSTISNQQWLQVIANPSDKQQYYLTNNSGQVFLIEDGELNPQAILDLGQVQKKNHKNIQLTAMVLHPDFAFRGKAGFATFYTAHLSKVNMQNLTKRLQINNTDINYQYDAVITEWQFNQENLKTVKVTSQREILRIPVIKQSTGIKQLTFNPLKESWHSNYGLLHVVLPAQKEFHHLPLYSGVILRINPIHYGHKNYTIPSNNPYVDNSDIANEIILLGAQNIKQILWSQRNDQRLIISHQYNKEDLLTLSQNNNDWRNSHPEKLLSYPINTSTLLLYQGKELEKLGQHIIYIDKIDNSWQLNSINIINERQLDHKVEQRLLNENWSVNDDLKLFTDSTNEMIILDQSHAKIYRITQHNLSPSPATSNKANSKAPLLLLILVSCTGIYFAIKSYKSSQYLSSLTKHDFAHFEISPSKQKIYLYKKNQSTSDIVLNIDDITASQVNLNSVMISLINLNIGYGFNNDLEQDFRHFLFNEYRNKMVDEKIRTINLTLTDAKHSYPILLYARKGDKRLTNKRYKDVIEELVDWNWLVAKKINANNTGVKKQSLPVKLISQASSTHLNRPAQKKHQTNKVIATKKTKSQHIEQIFTEITKDPTKKVSKRKNENQDNIDGTGLVNSLDKLIELKQQGFLTDEEFVMAKIKLLSTLGG